MSSEPPFEPEFDSMKDLLLDMAQERSWDSLRRLIERRLLQRPRVYMVRLWRLKPGDDCARCALRDECPQHVDCLQLESSAEKSSLESDAVDHDFPNDLYRRVPLGRRVIGRTGESQELQKLVNMQDDARCEDSRAWAKEKNVKGMLTFPLVFKDRLLGVFAIFLEIEPEADSVSEGQVWGRILADHLAAAIANAEAFQEIESLSRFVSDNPNPVFRARRNGELIYANSAAQALFDSWQGACKDLPSGFCEPLEEALKTGCQVELESRNRGRIYSFDMTPIQEEGYVNVYGKDITEAKLAEEKLRIITAEKESMESELRLASRVQNDFLPQHPPSSPHYRFAARMTSAKFIGGDFYDFIRLGTRLGIVIGDVAGKGASAALTMAKLLSDLRYVSGSEDPAEALNAVNKVMLERSRHGVFATLIFLYLNLETGAMRISSAGHLPLLLRRAAQGNIEEFSAREVPVGVLPDTVYTVQETELRPGDMAFLFTDGAIEIQNPAGKQFGMSRLSELMLASAPDPESFLDLVTQRLQEYAKGGVARDDQTLLAFQRLAN